MGDADWVKVINCGLKVKYSYLASRWVRFECFGPVFALRGEGRASFCIKR